MGGDFRRLSACRLCGSGDLREYIDFGEVALGNNLQPTAELAIKAASYPLTVFRCAVCGHFQLGHAVDPNLLYATNYTYLTGIGPSFIRHFDLYSDWAVAICGLTPGALVLDVGSNDGTCLKAFKKKGLRVCGIDPAALPARIANENGIETINAFFGESSAAEILRRYGPVDLVTSHNVLAHVDDLAAVFRNVWDCLKEGGHFCFEVGYFGEVLKRGHFDTIYHEHLDYHHAAPLVRHLTRLGFDVLDLSLNDVQGGSIRLLLQKTGNGRVTDRAKDFLAEERNSVLYDDAFLTNWRRTIEEKMREFRELTRARVASGALVAGYGAPTKATLLMKMAGFAADEIAYLVEDNPEKVARFMPTTGIPIRARSYLADHPPKVLVIFAWNFSGDIISRIEQEHLSGMEIIVPLPQVQSKFV